MNAIVSNAVPSAGSSRAALVRAHPRIGRAARWFWWIAGLGMVDSVVSLTGGAVPPVVGMAAIRIVDEVCRSPLAGIVLDLAVVAFFMAAGELARRGRSSAFVVAGVWYALDGAVLAWVGDWLSTAFHAYALFHLFGGWWYLADLLRHASVANQTPLVPGAPVALADPAAPSAATRAERA